MNKYIYWPLCLATGLLIGFWTESLVTAMVLVFAVGGLLLFKPNNNEKNKDDSQAGVD